MQELTPNNPPDQQARTGCIECGHPVVASGSDIQLCQYCRDAAIKFSVPRWIQLFAAGVLVVLAVAIYQSPTNFSLGLHLARGKKAVDSRNYQTAQNEFEYVLKKMPSFSEAQLRLMQAAYYNQDLETFFLMMQQLEGKTLDDDELLSEVNDLVTKLENYFPSDSLNLLIKDFGDSDFIPENELALYIKAYPEEIYPRLLMATRKFDQEQWAAADTILNYILYRQPDFVPALQTKSTVKRMLGQPDSCLVYADMILQSNNESPFAYAAKSRAYLYQKKDKDGLQMAERAVQIDNKDGYALASLALAHHFTGNQSGRDQLLKELRKDSANAVYAVYVNDVIAGKEIFRNN